MARSAILLLVVATGVAACGSVGRVQLPIDERPIRFVDAQSGAPIQRVLLIPQYSQSVGVATGGGHGPGAMASSLFVAFPVVYRSGDALQLRQPDSKGLLLPGGFIGQGLSIKGVTAIAPGYAGTWLWQLWDRPASLQVPLTPSGDAWVVNRDRLLRQLDQSRIRGADLSNQEREMFGVIPESAIDVRLGPDDRERVRQFLRASSRPSGPPSGAP
jgi:hypothetical protein